MGRNLSIWLSEEELERVRKKSKGEKRSMANYAKVRLFADEEDK